MASWPCSRKPRELRLPRHAVRGVPRDRSRTGAVCNQDRLPPARGGRHARRGTAHAVAHAHHAPRASRVEPARGTQAPRPARLGASFRTMWVAPSLGRRDACRVLRPSARPPSPPRCRFLRSGSRHPSIAWWLSRPLRRREAGCRRRRRASCAGSRARPGAFFETFVGEEDNWLPPDNFQEDPGPKIAHRTSPTNIGLLLLANLTAHDFGYISAGIAGRADDRRRFAPWPGCPGTADISTTGTTRGPCSRFLRATCRRSTAAISPATC